MLRMKLFEMDFGVRASSGFPGRCEWGVGEFALEEDLGHRGDVGK